MSMQNIPASGYIVPVADFKHLLTNAKQKELATLMQNSMLNEEICELLNSCIPDIPLISEVYYLKEEDSSEDMECDTFYAIFDESYLYIKTPTPALTFLNSKKIDPKFARWTVWG